MNNFLPLQDGAHLYSTGQDGLNKEVLERRRTHCSRVENSDSAERDPVAVSSEQELSYTIDISFSGFLVVSHDSIRGCVRPLVRWSVGPSVRR